MESNSVDRFYLRKKTLKCEDTRHLKQHILFYRTCPLPCFCYNKRMRYKAGQGPGYPLVVLAARTSRLRATAAIPHVLITA